MTVAIDIDEVRLVEADEKLAVVFAGIEAGDGARRGIDTLTPAVSRI